MATVLAIFLLYAYEGKKELPKPVNGILDLSAWDFEKGRPSLAGEWEFYWNSLYTYSEFQSMPDPQKQYIHVPGTWNSYRKDGKSLPGFGFATYRLKVIISNTGQALSLRLNNIATAYRLYANGTELVSSGTVGTQRESSKPAYRSDTVTFQPPSKEFFLILQVSNFSYARGGIWYDISMGTPEQIDALSRAAIYKDAILTGGLLMMALYYAGFYSVLRGDRSSRYLMLLCIVFILRTSLFGDNFIVRLFPSLPFEFLVFLTYANMYWIMVVLFLMIGSLYPKDIPSNVKKAVVIYGLGASLITAVLPMQIYTEFITGIGYIAIILVVYLIYTVVRAYIRHEKGALLILAALFGIFATVVHDILYHGSILHNSFGELMSVGVFQLLFVFSFILARRLSDAYEEAKTLTLQLGESLKKEKEAADELVKTELSFLKAQIKPHFLYNSLSVITALSTKNSQRTKALLYDLSDYLRGSFNFENYDGVTPLESELATVRAYLSIEKERFQGKLNVEYDIDESIDISLPLLTIQPLVENAIRHGIMKKSESGTVRLSVRKGEACTVIAVWDDGVGIPGGKLAEILSETALKSGVGLKNIQRRLNLHYGQRLEIQSAEGKGTTVTMRIPG